MNMITEYIAAQIREVFECSYCGKTEHLTDDFNSHFKICDSRGHFTEEQQELIDDMTRKMVLARETFNRWRAIRDMVETADLSVERICTCMDPEEPCRASRVCVYKRETRLILQRAKERFKAYLDAKQLTIGFRSSDSMRPLRVKRFKFNIYRLGIDKLEELDVIEEMKLLSDVDSRLWPIEDTMRKSFQDVLRYEMDPDERCFEHFMKVVDMLEAGDLEELGRADEDEMDPDGSYDEDFEEESMRFDRVAIWINNGLLKLERLVLKRAMKSVSCIEICEKAIQNVDYSLLMNGYALIRQLLIISTKILVRTMPIIFHLHELQNSNHFDEIYILGATNGPDTIKRLQKLAIETHSFSFEFRDRLRDKWSVRKKLLKTYKKKDWAKGTYRQFTLKMQEILWNMLDVNLNHHRRHRVSQLNAVVLANHYEELLAQASEPEADNVPDKYNEELEELIEDGKVNWYKRLQVNKALEDEEVDRILVAPSAAEPYPTEIILSETEKSIKEIIENKQRERRIEIMIKARNEVQARRNAKSKKPWANGTGTKETNENRCSTPPGPTDLYTELLAHACQQESHAQFQELSDEQISKTIRHYELNGNANCDVAAQQLILQEEDNGVLGALNNHQNENDELVMEQGLQVYHNEILYDVVDMDIDEDGEDEEEEGELRETEAENPTVSEQTERAPSPARASSPNAQQEIDDSTSHNQTTTDSTEQCGRVVRKRQRSLYETENEKHEAKKLKEVESTNGHQNGIRSVKPEDSTVSYLLLNDESDTFLCSALDEKYFAREGLTNEKYPRGRVDEDGFRIPPLPKRLIKPVKRSSPEKAGLNTEIFISENDFFLQDGNYVIKEEDGTLVTMAPTDTLYNPELDEDLFTLTNIGNNEVHEVENARSRFRRDHDFPDNFGIGEDNNMFGTMDSFLALAGASADALKGVSDDIDMHFLSSLNK